MNTTLTAAIFGKHEDNTLEQLRNVAGHGNVVGAAIMADGHFGYSQPIGGVVAYDGQISPSGVGYDIACGNLAVRTKLTYGGVKDDLSRIADEVFKQVEFGIGRTTDAGVDHAVFDDERWDDMPELASMKELARNQLGTVGSGNHYVDIFAETVDGKYTDDSRIWIGVHFGSRGFGHKTATGFLRLNAGMDFFPVKGGERLGETMMDMPTLLDVDSHIGHQYIRAMELAGEYAYAGRDTVVDTVLDILGTTQDKYVHNHHNFAWKETHGGKEVWVVRKGATPLWPGQESFIGGSMCDESVIVEGADPVLRNGSATAIGIDTTIAYNQANSFMSTVHGAGRVMGRMAAKGKVAKDGTVKRVGKVSPEMMRESVSDYGIQLRGAGVDESPFVYRRLPEVLDFHKNTTKVKHTLRPIVVCMAGEDVYDPFKD